MLINWKKLQPGKSELPSSVILSGLKLCYEALFLQVPHPLVEFPLLLMLK